jgi:hypothetical protein
MGSRHFSEGAYDRIAIKLFQKLNVDTYYLEPPFRAEQLGSLLRRPKVLLNQLHEQMLLHWAMNYGNR